jgi:cysteine desulfurase
LFDSEPVFIIFILSVSSLRAAYRRFGIGRFTTEEEIDLTLDLLETHVNRLREMSPLWEMVQEGIDLDSIEWSQDASHHHH